MAADATLPVRAAIVAALKADAGVGAVVGDRIYGRRPPEAVAFPYLSVGPVTGEPTGGIAQRGWDQSAQIDVWSRQPGGIDAEQALAAVSAVLEQARLTVSGHRLVMMRLEMQDVFLDVDGETTHGVQRYQIITREAA